VRTYVNLMLVMLIGGLWHGASWKFVVWGGLHGLYLIGERLLRARLGHIKWFQTLGAEILFVIVTNFLVCITWVFFRAADIGSAWTVVRSLFGAFGAEGAMVLASLDIAIVVVVYGAILVAHFLLRHTTHEAMVEATPAPVVAIIWSLMLFAIILTQGGGDAFLYFQF
jgi:alginate O-acetyltransferase complex protein AlgI